jgi:hypothetical protein
MLLSNVSLGSRQPLGFPLSPSAGTVRTAAILAIIRLASIRANNDTANVKYLRVKTRAFEGQGVLDAPRTVVGLIKP